MSMNQSPPDSIRMFVGYRSTALDVTRYREELGRTFMPGTPYMMQPLGLQAYIAAAIDETIDPAAPHEVALICYPSQAVYRRARGDTLRGRVYTQIHGGVYDLFRSGGGWPTPLQNAEPTASAFYLLPNAVDWQAGTTQVLIGVPNGSPAGQPFRDRCREVLTSASAAIQGCDQVLAIVRDNCIVVWLHASDTPPPIAAVEQHMASRVRVISKQTAERVICIGEPPPVQITGSNAFNFIFVRDANAGLV